MQPSFVRMIALAGALCGALAHLSAQTADSSASKPSGASTVAIPSAVAPTSRDATATAKPADVPTAKPVSNATAGPLPPSTSTSVTSTLPFTAKRPSLMVRKGSKEFEYRLGYSHSSRNAIFVDGVAILPVVVVGQVGVERLRRDNLTVSVAGRYGFADNLLGEIRVPIRFENDRLSVPDVDPPQEHIISEFGLGDIEGSFSYQFPRKREEDVRWILMVGAKSTTGSDPYSINTQTDAPLGNGFWNSRISLSGVKISDPAALFWNIGFSYNFQRDKIPITQTNQQNGEQTVTYYNIKPGNGVDFGGGFAYAVNQQLSVNTGLSVSFNGSTTSNGLMVANSSLTSASLRLGMVWLTEQNFPVDLGLTIGLTDDSPDFSLEFRQSYKF